MMRPTGWKNDDGIVVTLNEYDDQDHVVHILQGQDKVWVTDLHGLIDALMAANAELLFDNPPSVQEVASDSYDEGEECGRESAMKEKK